jgi:Uma2 family endonuclease
LYEKYGVKEYFIVDPEDNMAIVYTLVNGRYKELYREPTKIESKVLGTTVSW